ncbi:hypothetical protein [Micromonospora arborensis]|uniref:hypothetical protein n=1 Tax=Micromonospora arborensis TaxID=2116518 RepID=UPI003717048A
MSTLPPIWLLDVDGVINAISAKPDRNVWPADQWTTGTARCAGTAWPILAARPVVRFIREAHESGRAEVRWHTTWQHEAAAIAELLDLPEFQVQHCPEFVQAAQPLAGLRPTGPAWWKLPAAERVVNEEGRALLWTDDDADWELRPHGGQDALARIQPTLIICPGRHIGLSPKNLRHIDAFLQHFTPTQTGAQR